MLTLTASAPVARLPHICDQCGRTIAAGERYQRVEGPSDWGWSTWKTCDQCQQLVRDLRAIDVYGEDENGHECDPLLTDVDWPDVVLLGEPWPKRRALFRTGWEFGAASYPTDPDRKGDR